MSASLAHFYAAQRAQKTTPPAARCKGEPPSVADELDMLVLTGATFHNDGKTIRLRDGAILHRTARRWVEVIP